MFVGMDEDEPVSELVIPPVVATVLEVSREPAQMEKTSSERVIIEELSVYMIDRIHVNELKVELSKRGVNKSGLKTDLMKKLKMAVANNVPMMEDRPAQVTDNAAGDQFEPGAY